MQNQPSILATFLPLIFMSIFMAVVAFLLAKEKGRSKLTWTILGAIPLINLACICFFVGAANLNVERKLDQILAELKNRALP